MSDASFGRVLVTGAAGFVGSRLVAALEQCWPQAEVIAVDHRPHGERPALDVADADAVDRLVARTQPTALVHLAAISTVLGAVAEPRQTWRVNVQGTLNIVLAIQAHAPACRLLHVSSAEVYGKSAFHGRPVAEDTLLQPANPYAASKAAADIMVQEATGRGLNAVIIRPFNHTGPGQGDAFVVPAFCRQIAQIEKGLQPPLLKVGELGDERDFLDVEDVIDLYVAALQADTLPAGLVVNAASGAPWRIGAMLDALLAMSTAEIEVQVDPTRLRPVRVPRILGDATRAREVLGWTPKRPFADTLRRTLDYWRGRV